jgi:hypothetical protein
MGHTSKFDQKKKSASDDTPKEMLKRILKIAELVANAPKNGTDPCGPYHSKYEKTQK